MREVSGARRVDQLPDVEWDAPKRDFELVADDRVLAPRQERHGVIECEQKLVRVPGDTRTIELAQQVDAFLRLRAALGDVAERDDQVDVVPLDVGERCAERNGVSVHVREESGAHSAELTDTPYVASSCAKGASGT